MIDMKRLLLLLIFPVLIVACSDFLEPKSESEYIPEDASALNEMLLGEAYIQPDLGGEIMNMLLLLDDDVMCTDSVGEISLVRYGQYLPFLQALFSWQPDVFVVWENSSASIMNQSAWEVYYDYILGANAALDYIDDVMGTEDEKNNVKAQALALRAYYYFQLVNIWGAPYNADKTALGVPLKLTSALEAKELPRNTVEEIYTQIVKDLEEAERLYSSLPEDMQFKRDFRTSLPMVQLLKSRVFLYMENWEQAAIEARKVIDNPNFELMDLNSIQKTTAEPYYNFISMECSEAIWLFGRISTYINLVDIDMEIPDPYNESATMETVFFNASSDLLNRYEKDDLRKENYILRSLFEDSMWERHIGGYLPFGKFKVDGDYAPVNGENFAHAFRLSEAYLNLAEAAAMNKDEGTALEMLNALREKRFVTGSDYEVEGLSGEALLDKIREERRLELCFEGHRWFDLRRYGMPSITHEWKENGQVVHRYVLEEGDLFYTLPIPQNVMEANRQLVQNPLPAARN